MPFSVNLIRKLESVTPELRGVLIALLEEVERQREESVTKKAFEDFVRHTEENFQRVWKVIKELANAQKRTETKVEELAEAQRRTEKEVEKLARGLEETRRMVGGLSDTVGYTLEDKIFPYMADFARREYGIDVDVVDRRNIVYPDGRFDEVNVYVEGMREGEKVYVAGECKARPCKRDITRFSKIIERLKRHLGSDVEGFIVGYYYTPEVEKFLREKHPGIRMMKSFEFEMKYEREKAPR